MPLIRPLRRCDCTTYRSWFSDPETYRWMSAPDRLWEAHVFDGSNATCFGLYHADTVAAVLQVDRDENGAAHISVVVDPALRGRGLAIRLAGTFLDGEGKAFSQVMATIAADNSSSLRLAAKLDFREVGTDEHGLRVFRYEPPPPSRETGWNPADQI